MISWCGVLSAEAMQGGFRKLWCWVESAAMPFAEWHYPFENKEFESRFRTIYGEYIAQTELGSTICMYYLLLFDSISFENVVSTRTI